MYVSTMKATKYWKLFLISMFPRPVIGQYRNCDCPCVCFIMFPYGVIGQCASFNCDCPGNYSSSGQGWETVVIIAGVTVVGAAGAAFLPGLILGAAGFGAGGVAAGSAAAAWQASIGNVAAGSLFATLQSAGVVGVAGTTTAAAGATGAGVTAAAAEGTRRLWRLFQWSDDDDC